MITSEQAYKITRALTSTGFDISGLTAENPFELSTSRARAVQAIIQAADPDLASELVTDVPQSLGYVAYIHAKELGDEVNYGDLPESVKNEIQLRHSLKLESNRKQLNK